MVRDCWQAHALPNCTQYVQRLPFKLLPHLDKWCLTYHDRSFVCSIPRNAFIASVAFGLACTTLVLLILVACIACRRYRRLRQHILEADRAKRENTAVKTSPQGKQLLDVNQNEPKP